MNFRHAVEGKESQCLCTFVVGPWNGSVATSPSHFLPDQIPGDFCPLRSQGWGTPASP